MDPMIEETSIREAFILEKRQKAAVTMAEKSAVEHMAPFSYLMEQPITETSLDPVESGQRTHWPKNSIFRVPAPIRSSRESNFKPKLVSIGPYYHGQENLKSMEHLKTRCIQEIWKMLTISKERIGQPFLCVHTISEGKVTAETMVTAETTVTVETTVTEETMVSAETMELRMVNHEWIFQQFMVSGTKARSYYKEEFHHSPEIFVKMPFLDSCFIIRTILAFYLQVQESMSFLDVHVKEVRSDMLLLDNQIPLFFIKEVYQWVLIGLKEENLPSFNTVLEPFISLDMPWKINHAAMSSEAAHLLDLYWRCSLSPQMYLEITSIKRQHSELKGEFYLPIEYHSDYPEKRQSTWAEIDRSNNALMVIANATELYKMAGIEFEKFKHQSHLDVMFSKGIMRMPHLKIDSRQITLLRNLIAFENCILPRVRTISYYMKLMDALIDSEQDVELLQQCGVIYNTLNSHETAATFFNDIGNFCFIDSKANRFSGLYEDVQKYYNSSWHRSWASLRNNYFSSPWTGMSVVAAVTLLILSVLQTFYAIYGYYKPKN